MYRYLVVEYCFRKNDYQGDRHDLGAYETMSEARAAAGQYITLNVKKMRRKYQHWNVRVHKVPVYFPIEGIDLSDRNAEDDSKEEVSDADIDFDQRYLKGIE